MARVLITGSTTGLGHGAARQFLVEDHEVVPHARSAARIASVGDLDRAPPSTVISDLASVEQTRDVADQLNAIGPIDAGIHNAGIYVDQAPGRDAGGPRSHPCRQRPRAVSADRVDRSGLPRVRLTAFVSEPNCNRRRG